MRNRVTLWCGGSGTCHGFDDRAPPLFMLRWGENAGQHVVFDLSAEVRRRVKQGTGFDVADADDVNVCASHIHEDHWAGAISLYVQRHCHRFEKKMEPGNVRIFAPPQVVEQWVALRKLYLPDDVAKDGLLSSGFVLEASPPPTKVFAIDNAVVSAHMVFHGDLNIHARGFKVKVPDGPTVVYTGDLGMPPSSYWQNSHQQLVCGADVIICDASARIGQPVPRHLDAREAGVLAQQAGAKLLILTHYTGLDAPSAMIQAAAQGYSGQVEVAEDGRLWDI